MYLLQKISPLVLTILTLNFSNGCATRGGLSDDGVVNLSHFSFSRPENPLWKYGYSGSSQEHFFRLASGDEIYSINFREYRVSARAKPLTADRIMIFFLASVESKLRNKAGSDELNVTGRFEQISINGIKFYTLEYTDKTSKNCSNGKVYVHFPFENKNTHYLYVHYKEVGPDCLKPTSTDNPEYLEIHQDFRNFLGSLTHKA